MCGVKPRAAACPVELAMVGRWESGLAGCNHAREWPKFTRCRGREAVRLATVNLINYYSKWTELDSPISIANPSSKQHNEVIKL